MRKTLIILLWMLAGRIVILRNRYTIHKKDLPKLRIILLKAIEMRENDLPRFNRIAEIVRFPRSALSAEQMELINLVSGGKAADMAEQSRQAFYYVIWVFWSAFTQKAGNEFEIVSPLPGITLEQFLLNAG